MQGLQQGRRPAHDLLDRSAPFALALALLFAAPVAAAAKPKDDSDKGKPAKAEKAEKGKPQHAGHPAGHHDGDDDHGQGDMRFAGLDKDGDGRITREEWRGNDVSFANHDWNDDGVLSGPEVTPGADRDDDDDDDLPASAFDRLDDNNDGRLSRAEWPGRSAEFGRLDRNDDGFLTRSEFDNPTLPTTREQRFGGLDGNRDGRLSAGEWRGDHDAFARLDMNHDGFISRQEFLTPPASLSRLDRFMAWDHNDDGRLALSEWHADTASFNRLDDNLDGVVSLREYEQG